MAMTITVVEAKEVIERLQGFVAEKQAKIEGNVKDMQKAIKKGDFNEVRSLNKWIARYFESIQETERQIEDFTYELKLAEELEKEGQGWKVVVDFLEEMYESDMVWYKELKELSHENLKKETKSTQLISQLSEKQAERLFRNDVTLRFKKLVVAVKKKAGDNILAIDLGRNDNNGLDGIVKGDEGTVRLETIIAGGYNIQRAHYRTLVK